jgi:hypothetical protein
MSMSACLRSIKTVKPNPHWIRARFQIRTATIADVNSLGKLDAVSCLLRQQRVAWVRLLAARPSDQCRDDMRTARSDDAPARASCMADLPAGTISCALRLSNFLILSPQSPDQPALPGRETP